MSLSQRVEQMRSQEVGVFENTAVWDVDAGHDLAISMQPRHHCLEKNRVMEKAQINHK